jgi:AcrR family transcriptional regulator
MMPVMTARAALSANRGRRGEIVIHEVLRATLEELARVGYRALRIEDVAARAQVNKTTIYRRWPTKLDLLRETLRTLLHQDDPTPDTGSLRGDLIAFASRMVAFLGSPNGQVFIRLMMTEGADDDLRAVADSLRDEKEAIATRLVERGRARREIRDDVDVEILLSSLVGGLHHRILVMTPSPKKVDVESHVDLILLGAAPREKMPR